MQTTYTTIPLWGSSIPGSLDDKSWQEAVVQPWGADCLEKVSQPRILLRTAPKDRANGACVLVCPGGGYEFISIINEGYQVADWLNQQGYACAILLYRLPSPRIMLNTAQGPLQDAREALRLLRARAEEWGLNPGKIGIMGFSAGGHLAASLCVHADKDRLDPRTAGNSQFPHTSAQPDFSLLVYPVISLYPDLHHSGSRNNLLGLDPDQSTVHEFSLHLQVSDTTAPAFLVHSMDDGAVPWRNSLVYLEALQARGIPAELHLYPTGGHGYGLSLGTGQDWGPHAGWSHACSRWLDWWTNRQSP